VQQTLAGRNPFVSWVMGGIGYRDVLIIGVTRPAARSADVGGVRPLS
jgi:hypothetical protein